ncbi:hypothetical protein A0J61_10823 [Choanephora cucurbitarum]|uniref:CCHC-type domain-containing protein n=1 Tax=Choanephora cucurbitarum TaxID=101091 RepID=A0A1C7MWH2_9FUNG|nr:hypothetical protein A0J61_10823 [Choanephora cucurbitarum]
MTTHNEENIISALNQIVTQNRYAALQSMRLIYNYVPGTNIELWLRIFHQRGKHLGLDDGMLVDQLPSYLPVDMAQWILSSLTLDTWTKVKKALTETYGIPVAAQKQMCREKLEALQQGNTPSRQFKARFQMILQELPEGVSLPAEQTRSIYLCVMNQHLAVKICGFVSSSWDWSKVANKAIEVEDMLTADHRLAALYLQNTQSPASIPTVPLQQPGSALASNLGPAPMGRQDDKRKDRFNQWVRPGVPLCGHCGKEGHLSKRCRSTRCERVNAMAVQGTTPVAPTSTDTAWAPFSHTEVGSDSYHTTVNYAVVPEASDTAAPTVTSTETVDAAHTLCYLSQKVDYREGFTLNCSILGTDTQCLIDSGATFSAISIRLAEQLKLPLDKSQKLCFTTATGVDAWTHGTTDVQVMLNGTLVNLHCHVVEDLAYPIIAGVKGLKANKAFVDFATYSIKFPGSPDWFPLGRSPGEDSSGSGSTLQVHSGNSGSSGDAPLVSPGSVVKAPKRYLDKPNDCHLVDTLLLPGHHHAYCTISGHRNTLAMVTTPTDLAAEKLIAVAAGIVQFDNYGHAF